MSPNDLLREKRQAAGIKPVSTIGAIAGRVAEQTAEPKPVYHYEPPPSNIRTVSQAKLSDLDTSHPLVAEAVDMARAWAERKKAGVSNASLVLCGPVGTGKTHIARAILWSICYELDGVAVQPAGRFWSAIDMLMLFTPIQNDWGGVEISQASQVVGNAPIVVIDDVGTEQAIPFVKADDQAHERASRYFRMIDYCCGDDNRPGVSVVITSNLSLANLERHIGKRAWSRLLEMAPAGYMIDLAGVPDWRRKAGGR